MRKERGVQFFLIEFIEWIKTWSNPFNCRLGYHNIAGRLPENSRNRFVDRHSKKTVKKTDQKKFVFSLKADMLYFDLKSV